MRSTNRSWRAPRSSLRKENLSQTVKTLIEDQYQKERNKPDHRNTYLRQLLGAANQGGDDNRDGRRGRQNHRLTGEESLGEDLPDRGKVRPLSP